MTLEGKGSQVRPSTQECSGRSVASTLQQLLCTLPVRSRRSRLQMRAWHAHCPEDARGQSAPDARCFDFYFCAASCARHLLAAALCHAGAARTAFTSTQCLKACFARWAAAAHGLREFRKCMQRNAPRANMSGLVQQTSPTARAWTSARPRVAVRARRRQALHLAQGHCATPLCSAYGARLLLCDYETRRNGCVE